MIHLVIVNYSLNLTFRLFITYLITFRCVYCAHHIKFVLMIRLKEVEGLIFEFTTSSSPYILWHHEEHCTIFEDRKIMPYLCFCSDKTRDIITTVAFIIDYMKWSSFAVNQRKMFVFYEFTLSIKIADGSNLNLLGGSQRRKETSGGNQ